MAAESRTVLIAYDGSWDAATAIRHAGELLATRRAVVVHVWESLAGLLLHTDVSGLTATMRAAAEELDEDDRAEAGRLAAEGAELARAAGFTAEARAAVGKPKAWPALLAVADEVDADVIVIGSRGQGAVASTLFGSVSSGLLHHTRRPVLVVPALEQDLPSGPALIAFDGSDAARTAIAAAGQLLAPRDAIVGTVWMPYSGVAAGGALGAPVGVATRAAAKLDETVAGAAGDTAAEGAALAAAVGFEARAQAIEAGGPFWAALRDTAEAHSSPVVVIGTRGRGPLAARVLGSVSSAVIHHAHVPVLVVPPAEA